MKAVVLKTFRDKYTGTLYAPGQTLTVERERFSEIQEAIGDGYIAEIVTAESAQKPESLYSGEIDSGEIAAGTVRDSAPEPESGDEVPLAEDPAPPDSPKSKRTKKE